MVNSDLRGEIYRHYNILMKAEMLYVLELFQKYSVQGIELLG